MKPVSLLPLLLVVSGCDEHSPARYQDPAMTERLKDQPSDYAGLARWAHQYMTLGEVSRILYSEGYDCQPVDRRSGRAGDSTQVCRYTRFDPWPGTAIVRLEAVGQWLHKAEGERLVGPGRLHDLASGWLPPPVTAPGLRFVDVRDFADFVVDELGAETNATRSSLNPYRVGPNGIDCKAWAKARQAGWPKWDGKPVMIEPMVDALNRLRREGFSCPDLYPSSDELPAQMEGEYAWIECKSAPFTSQEQRVRLGVWAEDCSVRQLRVLLDDQQLEIPLVERARPEKPNDRAVVVREARGRVRRITFSLEGHSGLLGAYGSDFEAGPRLPQVDAPSRPRLLRAAAWYAEDTLAGYSDPALVPLLQRLDVAAYLFARLAPETLKDWSVELPDLSPAARAAAIVAECLHGDAASARACFEPYRSGHPEVMALYRQAVSEVMPFVASLPDAHPVRKRLSWLSLAISETP